MGCSQSKMENEETVARCKDRKQCMKHAVSLRNAFAAAHSSYATYLKNTGAALVDFAQGELRNPHFPLPSSSAAAFEIPLPPPPLPDFPAPLRRSATMPEIKPIASESGPVGTIIEEEEEEGDEVGSAPSDNPMQQHAAFEYLFPSSEKNGALRDADVERRRLNKEVEVQRKVAENSEDIVRNEGAVTSSSGKGLKGKQSVNLLQIFADLDDHFLKASESAREVSKMLEATRLHYHSNFADNTGHIDHSAKVMQVITWNRSFRGIPNSDDAKDDFDSEKHETLATVLDKLQAWEKKLYDEVKAAEIKKFEYQRKVAALHKLKERGTNSEALQKAKATVSHLHTTYIVDMQSMDSTVSEINHLRDQRLYPKLVQLVQGMATMWERMRAHHERQSSIVMLMRSLDISESCTETSEQHHDRTYQLLIVVQEWQSQFEKLINNQKGYIKALNSWLRLNLIPIESDLKENISSPPRVKSPPIRSLLHAWQDQLEKLPDELARTAIANFAAVVDTIFHQQEEEKVLKKKCEETQKEYSRKRKQFNDWEHKYKQKRMPDEFDRDRPGGNDDSDEVVKEKQLLVELMKKRLDEEEEAYAKHCLQVRQKTLVSLKNQLPELFRAMSDFSLECSKMYIELRSL
ncbi:nitrate regulatory gene2 protein-like [Abrus precatorius]|uniref:Nitrate regulatory gene2 protein-like n=1 Tax=Abrus precatorius TaxID=3816 RepID=A0A8B8KLU0_ABRPR|nr:nitrate regulatory gene2 protein-like [Abrus precatorius]